MQLTVIITCYNNEKTIEQCIRSVLTQSLVPDEIIVVDDCSLDSTTDIVGRLAQSYDIVRLLKNDVNSGPSVGRNRGILEAASEYVTTLDGDDYYNDNDKLKREMELIEHYRIQGKDIAAYSYIKTVNQYGDKVNRKHMRPKDYAQGRIMTRLLAFYKPSTFPRDYCVRKSILIDAGLYCNDMRLYEDLDLLIRVNRGTDFFCTGQYGTCYRLSDSGLSSVNVKKHNKVLHSIWRKYIKDVHGTERLAAIMLHCYTVSAEAVRGRLRQIYHALKNMR